MIPSKVVADVPRKTEQVGNGIFVSRNSYTGKYVYFQRGNGKNVYLVRLRKPKAQRSSQGR